MISDRCSKEIEIAAFTIIHSATSIEESSINVILYEEAFVFSLFCTIVQNHRAVGGYISQLMLVLIVELVDG